MGYNWITMLASAIAGSARDKTNKYNATRSAEGAYDAQEKAFSRYIAQLRQELAPFLRGEALPSERAATEGAKTSAKQETIESTKRLQQAYARAGITGGVGEGSVSAKGLTGLDDDLTDRLTGLEAELQSFVGERQQNAIQTVAGAEANKAGALSPLSSLVDQTKGEFRVSQNQLLNPDIAMQTILPSLIAGGSNMMKGLPFGGQVGAGGDAYQTFDAQGNPLNVPAGGQVGLDPSQIGQQQAMQGLMSSLGVDSSLFAQPDQQLPSVIDGTRFDPKTETDFLGKSRTTYDESPSAKFLQDQQKINTSKLSSIEQRQISNMDQSLSFAQATGNKKAILKLLEAKKKYIENADIVGFELALPDGQIKTYAGRGVWK